MTVTSPPDGYAARRGRHVRVSAFYDQPGDRGRKALMVLIAGVTSAAMFALAWYAYLYVANLARLGQVTPSLRVPLYLTYVWVPIGRAGDIDVTAAGMLVTPERCELIAFSEPTYRIGQAFAVAAGNPGGLTDYRGLAAKPEARIGLLAGAVEHNYAYVAGVEAGQVEIYPDVEEALAGLKGGEVDAVGLTSLSIRNLVDGEERFEATAQFYPEVDGERVVGYGAFGFRQEDEALREAFNRELEGFIGSEEHLEAVAPFGFTAEMVPERSVEELCGGE